MNDITKWESSQQMVDLFNDLRMSPKYLFSHEILASGLLATKKVLILKAFFTNEGYLVMELNKSDKHSFLRLFVGGTDFSNVVGAKPWSWKGSPKNVAADFYASLGRGNNQQIYFDKGWIAWFPEGYSTMTLVEFFDEPKPDGQFNIEGRVFHGERAFARLKVLEAHGKVSFTASPDSINRWEI